MALKYLLCSIAACLFHFSVVAQAPDTAMKVTSEEYKEFLFLDKTNGTHVAWNKDQVKKERKKCEAGLKDKVADPKKACTCMVDEVAEVMNYDRYIGLSGYQQGRALGYLGVQGCLTKM